MSRSLAELKREAREAAQAHGHELLHFAKVSARLHVAQCSRCGRQVQINSRPTGEEVEIGGEPIKTECS